MKKLIWLFSAAFLFVVVSCQKDSLTDIVDPIPDQQTKLLSPRNGPSTETIESMIDGGIAWLLTQRNTNGSFSGPSDIVARTAMAVVKLCDRSVEMGYAPLDTDNPFYTAITEGLAYIESQAHNGSCGTAYSETSNTHHYNYSTSWALMAFAATRDASYETAAQGAADYLVNSQSTTYGGWGYNCETTENWNDQSNSGYSVLALVAAENYGLPVSADKSALSNWIDFTQNDANGGCGYTNGISWINVLKTGNLLFEMAYVGDDASTPRVQHAVSYIENNWTHPNMDVGWQPTNFQAMYTMMKGFTALGIDEINVSGAVDWYEAFATAIADTKQGSSPYYWPSSIWTDEYLSTIFALLTLEKVVEVPYLTVGLDIKPTSCPNPFNLKNQGVLPVAILGSEDLDVSQIDVSTVLLEGIAPLSYHSEDVAGPVTGSQEDCACTTDGPDGYTDLTLKFDSPELASLAAIQSASDGDVLELKITGNLLDGKAFLGKDCIVILKKGNE